MIERIHFIAIGGALMHNLALALHQKGYEITGSDDEIYNPSRSRLEKAGLLPQEEGWFPDKITANIDAIILGMHARADNPELLKAKELGLTIYSYPEYLYQQSQDKTRVVVGGSHGKTTTTAMIMHILRHHAIDFDYAVGAQLEGFDLMVRLSEAPLIIIEGDEYLSSPIDRRPKFLHYYPHIAVLTGIAWDHINVFPTFKLYKKQFKEFIKTLSIDDTLIYYRGDKRLRKYARKAAAQTIGYQTPAHTIEDHQTFVSLAQNIFLNGKEAQVPLKIFGEHNLQNMQAARLVCQQLGLNDEQIFEALRSFKGADKRLEQLKATENKVVYKDFAHAPSKVEATVKAVKEQYPERILVAALELHTFSSLNKHFLEEYRERMQAADKAIVYYNKHTLKMKKLADITPEEVQAAFDHPYMEVFTDKEDLAAAIQKTMALEKANLLLMSSGNWGGLNLKKLIE